MDFSGEYRVPAPRERVWEALNDPDILKVCIDGCEDMSWTSDDTLKAVVRAKVGPVSARFTGTLKITDQNPPSSYVLTGQGQGGAAGFAKGSARVDLAEEGAETLLSYTASTQVGGKLASVGQRLVQGVANKTAEQFFERFTQRLQVALLAEAQGMDIGQAEADAFEVRPVELPAEFLASTSGAEAAGGSGTPAKDEASEVPGRPLIPLASAQTLIIPAGFGLFVIVLGLVFLTG